MTDHTVSATAAAPRRLDLATWAVLALPPLFWAGNFIVGRAARGDIPPLTLSFGRWVVALLCLLPFAWRPMWRDRALYWRHRWAMLRLALAGVALFNTLVYLGLQTTTAANALLLNSFIPVLIVLFGAAFYAQRLRAMQVGGLLLSSLGVLAIVLHGEPARLVTLQFAPGDLIVFVGVMVWALYTLWLRQLPPGMDRLGAMGWQVVLGLVMLAPLFVWEWHTGARPVWRYEAVMALLYVGIVPSVAASLLYMRAIAQVGAARAGVFLHLIPVYGAVLSVLFLGEQLHAYHALGMTAIFAGLALSNRRG